MLFTENLFVDFFCVPYRKRTTDHSHCDRVTKFCFTLFLLVWIVSFLWNNWIYMRISPRYSFAPSPRPLLATGEAHRTLDLAVILRMMAPGCSACELPALYRASETQAQLNPLSRQIQVSSTSASPWSDRCRILAMVVMIFCYFQY